MGERATEFPEIDAHLEDLRSLQRHACAYHGYLHYLVNHSEISRKYADSFTGHLVELQINSVISAAVMLVCSLWDKNGHSLPEFAKAISDKSEEMIAQRRNWRPKWNDELLRIPELSGDISEFCSKVESIGCSQMLSAVKVHRDEEIAHPLKGRSGQRRKHDKAHGNYSPAKYNDLIELLEQSAQLVSDAISIWHFEMFSHEDLSEWYQKYSDTFWKNLPVFADIEN